MNKPLRGAMAVVLAAATSITSLYVGTTNASAATPPTILASSSATFTVGFGANVLVNTLGSPTPTLTNTVTSVQTALGTPLAAVNELPQGVTFTDNGNGTASLSGVPVAGFGGIYSMTFTAANGTLPNATQNFTLTVNDPMSIAQAVMPATITARPASSLPLFEAVANCYPVSVGASNWTASWTYSTDGGTNFQPWVDSAVDNSVLDSDGQLDSTGLHNQPTDHIYSQIETPDVTVAMNGDLFKVTFTGPCGTVSSMAQLVVAVPPVFTSNPSTFFLTGQANTFLVSTTSSPSALFLTESGALPAGVVFADNFDGTARIISNSTLSAVGDYPITITANNNYTPPTTQDFILHVRSNLLVSPATLPDAVLSTAYSETVSAIGGSGAYAFTVIAGALPPGITLSATGSISGTPTVTGVYSFTIQAADTASGTVPLPGSQAYTISVNEAPLILTNPVDQSVLVGQNASFSASADGFPSPTVQWQTCAASPTDCSAGSASWSNIGSATSGTYGITGATAGQNGTHYRAVFHNSSGADAISAPALLTVSQAPSILTNPTDQTVHAGDPVTFTASASGLPTPTVQWQGCLAAAPDCSAGSAAWTNISTATSASFTIPATTLAQTGERVRAVFTNSLGSATTTSALLTVLQAPLIVANPTDQTVNAGDTGTFTASASGNPLPTVQWQQCLASATDCSAGSASWTNVGSATSTTLTLPSVVAGQNGNHYRAVFHNSSGADATTTSATLHVTVNVATTTMLTVTPSPTSVGTAVTMTATVARQTPPGATPTGTVSFYLDGSTTAVATVALTNGVASFVMLLSGGSHHIVAVYDPNLPYLTSTSAAGMGTVSVTCTRVITGTVGSLTLSSGTTCLSNAHVTGGIIVSGGASLDLEHSTVDGSLNFNGAGSVRICGSSASAVVIAKSSQYVMIGDALDGCSGNTFAGSLTATKNTNGIVISDNTVRGALLASDNSGSSPIPGRAGVIVSGNSR